MLGLAAGDLENSVVPQERLVQSTDHPRCSRDYEDEGIL